MKKHLAILLIALFILPAPADAKEFEGIVTYSIKFVRKSKSVKNSILVKAYGKKTTYYYKNGCHKWYCDGGQLEFEVYNPALNPDFIVSKFYKNDTLYYSSSMDSSETVAKNTPLDKDVICDKLCRGVTFSIVNEKKKEVLRRTWYYPSSGYEYTEGRYARYKLMGQNSIVQYCGAVPFRIVMEWTNRAYYIIYEAVKIEETPLDDNEFAVDSTTVPVKYLE